MVSLIFALILALPLVLYQLYSFLLPALRPDHQRIARSSVLAIPGLFVAGVAFGYVIVLPAALHFFQNFNSDQFNVLVQAGQYYKFAAMTLLAMGLLFQIPVGILAVTQAGIVTARQLRANRRYAILACVVVAAILPSDAITMVLEVVPLYLLFEGSLVLASFSERRARRRAAAVV
jgi:sec-independent protein translocase protein TatC